MPAKKSGKSANFSDPKTAERTAAPSKTPSLPESMLAGKASSAKASDGDAPVFAYIASLPYPQRGIAERVDALAATTLPGLQRAVKWGMSYYGVGDGWCFCCGGFANHVKLMFVNGVSLTPVPPVTPWRWGRQREVLNSRLRRNSTNARSRRGCGRSRRRPVSGRRNDRRWWRCAKKVTRGLMQVAVDERRYGSGCSTTKRYAALRMTHRFRSATRFG